jgi:hypothetical protein
MKSIIYTFFREASAYQQDHSKRIRSASQSESYNM